MKRLLLMTLLLSATGMIVGAFASLATAAPPGKEIAVVDIQDKTILLRTTLLGRYIFVHDDPRRGLTLDRRHIVARDLPIVEPRTRFFFDYCYIIEHAAELHHIDSSFRLLADSLEPRSSRLFHHTYVRGTGNEATSSSRLPWIVL